MSSVVPSIVLGDPLTGQSGDNLYQCFGKFNVHTHRNSASVVALLQDVSPGDAVQTVSDCLPNAFPAGTTVSSISRTTITVSQNATRSAQGCKLQVGTKVLEHANIALDSNAITFNHFSGFVPGEYLSGLHSKPLSGLINTANLTYPLLCKVPWKGILDKLVLRNLNGSSTVELLINTRQVAITNVTTNYTQIDFLDTGTNRTVFASGDDLFLRVTNATGSPNLHYSLYLLTL